MAVAFVECRADHLPALQAFFMRMYRPDYVLRANEALFQWQFGETPASKGNDYHVKLALLDGEIAGCLGYIPVEVSLRGRVVRGAWTANWMVDLKLRRLGLGPLLMRELTQQFDVTLVIGLSREAQELLPRMGWTNFGYLTRYICVLDIEGAAQLTESGKLDWPVKQVPHMAPSNVQLVSQFHDDATALWDTVWGNNGAGTRRSAEFLNWRYGSHPVFQYRLFEMHSKSRLSGFAVYRIEQVRDMPLRVGRIVELVSEAGSEGVLLDAVCNDARSQDVALLDFFNASQRFTSLMRSRGFLLATEEPAAQVPILFQPLDRRRTHIPFMAHLGSFSDAASLEWYVTRADGDQDRPN